MRHMIAVLLLLAARIATAAQPTHYVSIVNNASADIESIELVSTDGHASTIARHDRLRGGDVTMLGISGAGECRRDLRLAFADDRRVIVRNLDVCRDRQLHTRELYMTVLRARDAVDRSGYAALAAPGNDGH